MATLVGPPDGIKRRGKHHYSLGGLLFEVDSKYVPLEQIGKGAYGVVCSSVNTKTGEKVAIKKLQNVFQNSIEAVRTLREMAILGRVKHENVIALKDVMLPVHQRSFNDVYMVYELMDTDLGHIIWSQQPLTDEHCQFFLYQILSGLKYLHSANVLHRDLKPGNLLINANCDLKIADFGLARTTAGADEVMTEYVVTRWYRAPELLVMHDNYGASIDIWSVGCIFAEILGRKPIFKGTDALNQLSLIINVLGAQSEEDLEFIENPRLKRFIETLPHSPGVNFSEMFHGANPMAIDLLKRMLVFDPRKRITVAEALRHPYLKECYNPSSDIPARSQIQLDMSNIRDMRTVRQAMYEEILRYHSL
ncbi:hypothetical protein MLD38_009233 [Melastoma candidum]|uniref:Uncharacterized protein n=1 Tax=Melastoma candidum TaxID=119954 RepID=A0ACB9RZY6_9MYRT|nr:hypothetical protein MLD38_009233 [Melastoma candidum]